MKFKSYFLKYFLFFFLLCSCNVLKVYTYYSDGRIQNCTSIKNGIKNGQSITYDNNGNIIMSIKYRNDKFIYGVQYSYFPDLNIWNKYEIDANGNPNGFFISYYYPKVLYSICHYSLKSGLLIDHIDSISYRLICEYNSLESMPTGECRTYYKNGIVKSIEYYGSHYLISKDTIYSFNINDGLPTDSDSKIYINTEMENMKVGVWKFFRESGKLEKIQNWSNGCLTSETLYPE